MTDLPASDRYQVAVDEAERTSRWFRSLGVLISNVTSWIDGFGTGPSNPGGRTVKIVDSSTGLVVLEFVERFGDDAQQSLVMLESDIESQTVGDFRSRWL